MAVALGNVANLTLRQRLIPSELLGRVGNVLRFFIFGAMPLGGLLGGSLVAVVRRAGARSPAPPRCNWWRWPRSLRPLVRELGAAATAGAA